MSNTENNLFVPIVPDAPTESLNVAIIEIDKPITYKVNGYLKKTASEIVDIARRTFYTGKTKPVSFRKEQVRLLLQLLEENKQEFVGALKKDLGRHSLETLTYDINLCIHDVTRLLWNIDDWVKPERPEKPAINMLDDFYICNDPYGVVLVIAPWNLPVNLLFGPAAGAIAAGNCVVVKPSEIPAATEKLIAKLIPMYMDRECFQVYTGAAKETAELLEQKFDYIFFTGSPNVGRIVHAAANKHLTPVTLELGGKNPVYLDKTVEMEAAAKRILFGKCVNAGQICIAPDYMLCTSEVQDKFVESCKKVLVEWYHGNAKLSEDYPKIITQRHWQRLVSFIENRPNIALGGRVDAQARFIEPTVLTDVNLKDAIMQEEIFGPLLPIITVTDANEAIAIINKKEKPLAMYIFSNDKTIKSLFLQSCYSGAVVMNDTMAHAIAHTLPFGGVGLSGMGHYHGKGTFDTFVHKRAVVDKGYSKIVEVGLSLRIPPYSAFKANALELLMKPMRCPSSEMIARIVNFLAGTVFVIIVQLLYKYATH